MNEIQNAAKYYGMTITKAELNRDGRDCDGLRLTLNDGREVIDIQDTRQMCCESRWIDTDDDVQSLVGSKLIRIESKAGPTFATENDNGEETMFVEIGTDKGFITLCTHNEHNGYYGGFDLEVSSIYTDE